MPIKDRSIPMDRVFTMTYDRLTGETGSLNNPITEETTLNGVWGRREDETGREILSTTLTVTLRRTRIFLRHSYRANLAEAKTGTVRLNDGENNWRVTSFREVGRRRYMECLCTAPV